MLNAGETSYCFRDGWRVNTCQACGGRRCENIFEVVRSGKRNFGDLHHEFFLAVVHEHNVFAEGTGALVNALLAAEPEQLRLARRQFHRGRVVGIQDGRVKFGLLPENARFRSSVSFDGFVAVEVVGRKIQKNGDVRAKSVRQFQLKAA